MAEDEAVVTVRDVWYSFGSERGIRGLDLVVPRGAIFGLVGPSGSGKTTVARLLLGTAEPEHGTVSVLGVAPTRFSTEERERIGYLPQSASLYPELSLRHNLDLVASLYGLPWRARWWPGRRAREARERIVEVLDFVDLTENAGTRLGAASGGEQRRLGLAAAMVHEPELLVLDEPTAGVDPMLRRRIWDRLGALRDDGTTVFVTTQYVEEATHCDLVALLVDGRTLVVDTPDALHGLAREVDADGDVRTFDDVFVALVRRQQTTRRARGAT